MDPRGQLSFVFNGCDHHVTTEVFTALQDDSFDLHVLLRSSGSGGVFYFLFFILVVIEHSMAILIFQLHL